MLKTVDSARLAALSILVALVVMGAKFLAWRLTGSVALYSDALESIVNVIAALAAWWAIRVSAQPADDDHHFGHHKAEYLSAVAEGAMIVVAALLIFNEAVRALLAGPEMPKAGIGLFVNALAAAANGAWAYVLIQAGRARRSPALEADGKHILADVVTSVGVLIGLGLALATGWAMLDPIMALIVGANVLVEGWKVIRGSAFGLMDGAVDPEEAEAINQTILANADGAIEVHDIKTRQAGRATFIEFHLVVDGDMTVIRSHAICDRIEAALRLTAPGAHVTIHVEPGHKAKPDGLPVK